MSNDVQDFLNDAAPWDGEKHEAFSFNAIGDTLKGVIVEPPRVIDHPNKFNPGQTKTSMVLAVKDDAGTTWALWAEAKKGAAQAIYEACQAAGVGVVAEGGIIAIRLTELKDTGKGNPFKVFGAAYQPPAASAPIDQLLPNQPAAAAEPAPAAAPPLNDLLP